MLGVELEVEMGFRGKAPATLKGRARTRFRVRLRGRVWEKLGQCLGSNQGSRFSASLVTP